MQKARPTAASEQLRHWLLVNPAWRLLQVLAEHGHDYSRHTVRLWGQGTHMPRVDVALLLNDRLGIPIAGWAIPADAQEDLGSSRPRGPPT